CALSDVPATCQSVIVTQDFVQEGFHRELLVKVELGSVGENAGGCTIAARTRLPAGIYVDPYELALLKEHSLTQAVLIPDVTDVEAPEYLATDHLLVLYMEPDPRCSRCFRAALPVHGRYHRPAEEGKGTFVVLKSPEVLLCCCDTFLLAECWAPAEVEAPCWGKTKGSCQWYNVTHISAHEESILQVPVGLRQHSSSVCVVTLLITGLCSSLILAAVYKYGHFS
ncbi:PIGX protein, partial [Turnix velox]|nr:PIGX protein [Turnix velox]